MCTLKLQIEPAVEEGLKDLADRIGLPMEELATVAASAFLKAVAQIEVQREEDLRQRIAELTPSNTELIAFARKHRPPREWLEGDDNPFEN